SATISMAALTEWPARSARDIRSRASGRFRSNWFMRRFRFRRSPSTGMAVAATPAIRDGNMSEIQYRAMAKPITPSTAELISTELTFQGLSAWARSRASLWAALIRCSTRSSQTSLLKELFLRNSRGPLLAATAGLPGLCTPATRARNARSAFLGRVSSIITEKVTTAIPTNTRTVSATSALLNFLRNVQQAGRQRNPGILQLLGELGHDSGGIEPAQDVSLRPQTVLLKQEDILQADDVAVGAGHFGHVGDAAGAVAHARDLHDDVNGRRHLVPQCLLRQAQVGHQRHGFNSCQRVPRIVGVNGGYRTVVAGVHGLQHIQRFSSAHLADHDAVGPHTQRVDDQLTLMYRTFPLDIRRPALQADHMFLLQLKLSRILDGHDPFPLGDESRQHVEQRRLARARASRHHDVQPGLYRLLQNRQHFGGQRALVDQVLPGQRSRAKAPD